MIDSGPIFSTPHTSGSSRSRPRQAGSRHSSSATRSMTACARSTSVPSATSTSTRARAHCCDMLATRSIMPLGTYQTVPWRSRRRVVRRVTASTVPVVTPTSMMSPTPYWSSRSMKMPERKSLTSVWAPKPMAMPAMPAPAMSGPRLMPSSPRTIIAAIVQMTVDASDRRTIPRVWARAAARRECEPVSSSGTGARRRMLRIRSAASGAVMRSTRRRMARRTSRLATKATARMSRTVAGVARSLSAASAQASLPVQSNTRRQTNEGSSPQASSRGAGWALSTGINASPLDLSPLHSTFRCGECQARRRR